MKILKYILFGVLVLLSLSTALTKIVRMPEEMALFANAGFPGLLTILFGIVQLGGAIMLFLEKARKLGAIIMTSTYIIATIVVFVNGMWLFGFISISFIILSAYFIKNPSLKNYANVTLKEPDSQ